MGRRGTGGAGEVSDGFERREDEMFRDVPSGRETRDAMTRPRGSDRADARAYLKGVVPHDSASVASRARLHGGLRLHAAGVREQACARQSASSASRSKRDRASGRENNGFPPFDVRAFSRNRRETRGSFFSRMKIPPSTSTYELLPYSYRSARGRGDGLSPRPHRDALPDPAPGLEPSRARGDRGPPGVFGDPDPDPRASSSFSFPRRSAAKPRAPPHAAGAARRRSSAPGHSPSRLLCLGAPGNAWPCTRLCMKPMRSRIAPFTRNSK